MSERRERIRYNAIMAREMEEWSGYLDWSARLQGMGVLTDRLVIQAFKRVRRSDFLPQRYAKMAGLNRPLPIGHGQANSQPEVVGEMLEGLRPRPGDKVLDFGAGSAWTTALLATIVRRRGRVIGAEVIPELVEFGRRNLAKYDFPQASIRHTPHELGYPAGGPYDCVLASARLPEEWLPELLDQVRPEGGRLVVPLSNGNESDAADSVQDIILFTRHMSDYSSDIIMEDVRFVPTVRGN